MKRTATLHFDRRGVKFSDRTRMDLDAVIMCTGYSTALPLLEQSLLAELAFEPRDQLQPTLLHRQVFQPALPGFAFIGHYRGPYFPVMELQSRWVAGIIGGEILRPTAEAMCNGIEEERRIRLATPRPQFPHGDYVALADGLAREVGCLPLLPPDHPLQSNLESGPVIAAHYRLTGVHARRPLAEATSRACPTPLIERPATVTAALRSRSATSRVMGLLEGEWAIDRTLAPGGHFVGTARFKPMQPDGLLYDETGTLCLSNGTELQGSNRYVYALHDNRIDVSFASGANSGAHFVDITFPQAQDEPWPLQSTDRHHCRLDQYDAIFRMESPDRYIITYVVCGPRKGYVSRSICTRLS